MEISLYDFGRIQINGHLYTSDVILANGDVKDGWWRIVGENLCPEDLIDILPEKPEILIVGTGYYGRMTLSPEVRYELAKRGITLHALPTREAVALFNRLQRDSSAVVAALHVT